MAQVLHYLRVLYKSFTIFSAKSRVSKNSHTTSLHRVKHPMTFWSFIRELVPLCKGVQISPTLSLLDGRYQTDHLLCFKSHLVHQLPCIYWSQQLPLSPEGFALSTSHAQLDTDHDMLWQFQVSGVSHIHVSDSWECGFRAAHTPTVAAVHVTVLSHIHVTLLSHLHGASASKSNNQPLESAVSPVLGEGMYSQ